MQMIGIWYFVTFVQSLLGFGTAYRLTKNGGDNGVALWGWILLMNLAAAVPGLGYYLWYKYRYADVSIDDNTQSSNEIFEDEKGRQYNINDPSNW